MYPPRIKTFAIVICLALALPSLSHAQDGSAVDLKALSASLAALKEKQAKSSLSHRNGIYNDISSAASSNASALAFYEEAMRNVTFAGQNREQTEFRDWRKKEADKFKDANFQYAIRLHLTYLALTLKRGDGATVKSLIPDLLNYTAAARSSGKTLQDAFMKGDLKGSIFVNWYQIGDWVASVEDWEMRPGNINGIFDRTILPELRAEKDPRVLQYWDERISTESQLASESTLTFEREKFSQIEQPALYWSRAKDMLAIGQKNNAIQAMFAVVKGYPTHPSEADWISQLEALIKAPAASPSPAPPASPHPH